LFSQRLAGRRWFARGVGPPAAATSSVVPAPAGMRSSSADASVRPRRRAMAVTARFCSSAVIEPSARTRPSCNASLVSQSRCQTATERVSIVSSCQRIGGGRNRISRAWAGACASIHLSIYPSIHLSIYPSIYLSIYLSIELTYRCCCSSSICSRCSGGTLLSSSSSASANVTSTSSTRSSVTLPKKPLDRTSQA
jgi:hypothetical protein